MLSPRGRDLVVWITVFTVLTFATLVLRFIALRTQRRSWRIDDYLVLGATASMIALEGCTFWAIHNGLGAHMPELDEQQVIVQFKLQFSANVTWTISTVCCKLSMLWFYQMVFSTPTFKKVVWTVMVLTVLYAAILIPVFFAACTPISASWNPALHATNCWPWQYHSISAVSFNMLLDLLVVFLPLPVVWNVKMPTKKKVAVSAMFALGLVIVVVMLWRLIVTVKPNPNPDYPYDLALVALQAHLELWLGLIAANLPAIAPLFPRLVPPRVKQYFISHGSSNRKTPNMLRTFGSSGPNTKKKDFDRLTDFDLEENELIDRHAGHISRNKITVQREIEVSADRH